ncbi:MAG: YlcI/YnfO family protein [Mycoplasmatota bacterium]|nr:YlcI/YnfO family protein [Mycoplasmatota bacterium]
MFKIRDNKIDTENKTIRFPLPLINRIEEEIKNKNVSFSKFVIQACEYALENMEAETKKKENE